MSTVNLNIVAEFDLVALEKAKKRMEEIEDVFLKLSKLSKIDFAKSFERFSKVSNVISDISSSLPQIYWAIIALYAEFGALISKRLLDWFQYNKVVKEDMSAIAKGAKSDKQIIEELQWAIQQAIPGAQELYDLMFEISKQSQLPDLTNVEGLYYWKDAVYELKGWVGAVKEVMNSEYAPLLQFITWLYNNQAEAAKLAALASKDAAEQMKRLSSIDYAKNVLSMANATEELTSNVDELKQKCQAALPSLRQFLAEGKLGDLAAYDTSKQSSIWGELPPPPTDIGDYDFGYTLKELEEQAQQFRKKDLTGWKGWADSIIDFFSSIHGGIQGTYESLKTGFTDIFDIFKSKQVQAADPFAGLGGLSAGAEASLGKGDVGFLSKIGAALGPIGKVASVIMQIPQIVKQVWNSIKSFATSVAKLFGWMSEEEKVQKDVLRDLGATISDDLAKKIADTSKDIGDRFTAVTLHLGDIIRETDITKDNFDDFASRARDVFSLLETGMIDATKATATLNDVFPQLADEMDKLGITFNKNMIDMIQLSRQFGLEVESIKQYVEEKLGIAIEGLTKATQNLGEVSQAEFDRLARAASAAFNELMKNGTDVAAAIDQMKTVIGNLSKAQEGFGLKGSAAFNQLKRYSNLVETNRAVIESVKGMQDVYTSLAQVGAMNQQLFKDWQKDTLANYDKLIEGGFKQNEALAMMAPNLQALKDAHETLGFKIDDNTRALIEQAEAAGLLKPDPMLQMTDAVLQMKDAVYDLIDHLAGKSPPCGSLIEAFDTVLMYTKSYGKELINAFSPMPVQALISKIGEIPTKIGIDVSYNYDEYYGPGGGYDGYHGGHKPYAAQHGGIFSVPTHLLVGENPAYNPEVVLNRFQLERLLNQTAKPARDLQASSSGGPTVINIHIAGEKVESVILPMLKQASRDGKVRIDARAIEE